MTLPTPSSPLSQVVFVRDYIQLVFDAESFSFYGSVSLNNNGVTLSRKQPGLCDALVALIGQSVVTVNVATNHRLEIGFATGESVVVDADTGPEVWQFCRGDEIVVGRD